MKSNVGWDELVEKLPPMPETLERLMDVGRHPSADELLGLARYRHRLCRQRAPA